MSTMLLVSCRRNFWSATDFSAADETRQIDLETGTGTTVTQATVLQALQGKRVTVLVHGYNNEELDVISAYRTIDVRMRMLGFLGTSSAPYDALVGFAWPGGAAGVSFPFARQRAAESASRFAALLGLLQNAGATVDVNTHSLGSHVAFEGLREGAPGIVRYAWNFASAVDNESIERDERYYVSSRHCERFYVFHSKQDPVLRVWYRIGDFFDFDTALGYSGPEDPGEIIKASPNVRVVNCKNVVQSHGGYRSSGEVWSYMLEELTRPSAEQFVTLSKTAESIGAVFRLSHAAPAIPAASRRRTSNRKRRSSTRPRRRNG